LLGKKNATSNIAPNDRVPNGPWPVATADRVPEDFKRFTAQIHDKELEREKKAQENAVFDRIDANEDGAISREEYAAEVQGRQNKTEEEMERLWSTYHTSPVSEMLRPELKRLADTGFNLGTILRDDISSVLEPPSGTPTRKELLMQTKRNAKRFELVSAVLTSPKYAFVKIVRLPQRPAPTRAVSIHIAGRACAVIVGR